jgi:hypothetical protein
MAATNGLPAERLSAVADQFEAKIAQRQGVITDPQWPVLDCGTNGGSVMYGALSTTCYDRHNDR